MRQPDTRPARRRGLRWLGLLGAAVFCAVAIVAWVADTHRYPFMLNLFDLRVYNDGGLLARNDPAFLYKWQLIPGIKFTYTPFAALIFGWTSHLSLRVLGDAVTSISVAALPLTAWLTFGALGWRGVRRATAALLLAGAGLWTEPVQEALHLGQIELILMLLIVADLCQPDRSWLKGTGIGLAAGIKLIPLIFIPYLLLAGKFRQAAVATAAFAATTVTGFILLPKQSHSYWLTGYFLHPRNTGSVVAPINQSLLALLARIAGGAAPVNHLWLACAVVIGVIGVTAGARLARSGRPVQGWVTCALTGLIVSPISWTHHWVWIVPIAAVIVDWAVRSRGPARWAGWAFAVVLIGLFGGWPASWTNRHAFLPVGLIGFFDDPLRGYIVHTGHLFSSSHLFPAKTSPATSEGAYRRLINDYLTHLSVPRSYSVSTLISLDLFIGAGLLVFLALIAAAVLAWRRSRTWARAAGPEADGPVEPAPGDVAPEPVAAAAADSGRPGQAATAADQEPGDAAADGPAPGETASGEAASEEAASGEAASGEAVPDEATAEKPAAEEPPVKTGRD